MLKGNCAFETLACAASARTSCIAFTRSYKLILSIVDTVEFPLDREDSTARADFLSRPSSDLGSCRLRSGFEVGEPASGTVEDASTPSTISVNVTKAPEVDDLSASGSAALSTTATFAAISCSVDLAFASSMCDFSSRRT